MSETSSRTGVKMSPQAAATLRVAPTEQQKVEPEHRAKPMLHSVAKGAKNAG